MGSSALDSCPKCGAPRSAPASACPRCGLAHDHMAAYAAVRDEVPAAVSAAWDAALASWSDPARHDALFQLIVLHGAYAWAAAKYRDHKRASNDEDPTGDRQVDRLRRAAEATLRVTGTARADATPKPYRALLAVLVVLIVATIVGLLIANNLRKPTDPNAARPAPSPPGAVGR